MAWRRLACAVPAAVLGVSLLWPANAVFTQSCRPLGNSASATGCLQGRLLALAAWFVVFVAVATFRVADACGLGAAMDSALATWSAWAAALWARATREAAWTVGAAATVWWAAVAAWDLAFGECPRGAAPEACVAATTAAATQLCGTVVMLSLVYLVEHLAVAVASLPPLSRHDAAKLV